MKRLALILGYGENVKDNLMLLSMQLVVITMPFVEHINSWAIGIMILAWLFTSNYSNFLPAIKSRKLSIYFISYFVWLAVGLIYTQNIEGGIQDLILKLTFLIFPFILLFNKRINQHYLRGVIRVFYYTLFITSIYMLVAAWMHVSKLEDPTIAQALGYFTYEQFAATIGVQPIYLSMYMVFCFFAVIWDFFLDPRIGLTKAGKWIAGIWAFHFYMMVILLSSRMELLVLLFISFVGIGYYDGKMAKKWILAGFKMVVLASFTITLLGVFPVNKARYEEMIDIEKDYTQTKWGGRSIRIHKWLNTLELISEQPFLGTGAGDMQDELQKVYLRNDFMIAHGYRFNPHNQYLQTWAATGLIGLFLLFGILIVSLIYSINSKNTLYIALVLLLALSMLTESMLERQKGLVFFSFFLLFFGGYYFNHKEGQSLSS
jgi:O-antigen ligase